MILLPYIHRVTTLHSIPVHSYTILTIGGTQLWTEFDNTVTDILECNDLYTDHITEMEDICLCSINTEKTNVTDFFKWNEISDQTTFCWRTLYTFGEKQNWLPHPNEYIGDYSYQDVCDLIAKDQKDI
jgi:hypothetical protein